MNPITRIDGFRGEFLWELDIAERQMTALLEAIPAEKFEWRPEEKARSISEIFVHVAAGNFMLLDALGVIPPDDLYREIPPQGDQRVWALIHRNDELEKNTREKAAVTDVFTRSLQSVRRSFCEADLDRRLHFFGEQTTVRRVYLRLLAHLDEHMGQMTAYTRINGLPAPWRDWRPDRSR